MEAERSGPEGRERREALALGLIAATCAAAAMVGRAWLLLGTRNAHGYDGWYYVLQVRSLLAGAPLFADDSWAFLPMMLVGGVLGDVVAGNALVGVGAAGVSTALAAVAGFRLGERPGAWVSGAVVAASTGHLSLSSEFLKNGVGLVFLMALWVVLVGKPSVARALWALLWLGLAAMTHKLCGGLALVSLAGWAVAWGAQRSRIASFWAGMLVLVVGVLVLVAGTLRGVDLQRGLEAVPLDRWARIRGSSLLIGERLEIAAVHSGLVWVGVAAWRGAPRRVWMPLAGLAVLAVAPGLPFSFEALSWRLLCMGFLPLALAIAACKPGRWAWGIVGLCLLQAPASLSAHNRRTPDYVKWRQTLPVLMGAVPPDARLVAHRGLCGFLWAESGLPCENFDPDGDGTGVWRVVYGVGAGPLEPYGAVVALLPGYVLVAEPDWRRFRVGAGARRSMVRDPRNPYQPRPAFVYGPKEAL